MTTAAASHRRATAGAVTRLPRLGFLGVGWIGRHRMEAIAAAGAGEIVALADPDRTQLDVARGRTPGAAVAGDLGELLAHDLDGLVIATPSALHAAQATQALERGIAVFCQKPLARTAAETRAVVDAARSADRLLGVDFSYRYTRGMQRVRELVQQRALGDIYAVDLVFHNAYGPDKPWFRDPQLAGGGCVIDLGIHLVDLALWTLDFPPVRAVSSRLFAGGRAIDGAASQVEDYAVAQLTFGEATVVRLACSWNLPVGRNAVIEAHFHGTEGGAAFRNVHGSFYDFVAERHEGTRTILVDEPPDDWGGRAAIAWCERLSHDNTFDRAAEAAVTVAAALDAIYGRDGH